MDIDLKNTKIDFTGKSDAEKIEFQEYCFSKGIVWRCIDKVTETTVDVSYDVYFCTGRLLTGAMIENCEFKIDSRRDITEEWANRNKDEEPRVYTSSREDVRDAIRDFDIGEEVQVYSKDRWENVILNDISLKESHKYQGDNLYFFGRIRKLQPAEPVNPYEELEENGKYKVVGLSDKTDLDLLWLSYNGVSLTLDEWASHKDFAGYVFHHFSGEGTSGECYPILPYCYDGGATHQRAIGVRFKVGE